MSAVKTLTPQRKQRSSAPNTDFQQGLLFEALSSSEQTPARPNRRRARTTLVRQHLTKQGTTELDRSRLAQSRLGRADLSKAPLAKKPQQNPLAVQAQTRNRPLPHLETQERFLATLQLFGTLLILGFFIALSCIAG